MWLICSCFSRASSSGLRSPCCVKARGCGVPGGRGGGGGEGGGGVVVRARGGGRGDSSCFSQRLLQRSDAIA
jgi:hypothetical protein